MNAHEPARADEVRDVAPEDPLPLLSDAVVRARAEAVSIEHRIQHFKIPSIHFVIFAIVRSSFPRRL